jgi:hypothetical protein
VAPKKECERADSHACGECSGIARRALRAMVCDLGCRTNPGAAQGGLGQLVVRADTPRQACSGAVDLRGLRRKTRAGWLGVGTESRADQT